MCPKNGSDDDISLTQPATLQMTVAMDAGTHAGENCDWWLVVKTPGGWYHFDYIQRIWKQGLIVTHQEPLRSIPTRVVWQDPVSLLHTGECKFYFGVDLVMNGAVDISKGYRDSVTVTVY